MSTPNYVSGPMPPPSPPTQCVVCGFHPALFLVLLLCIRLSPFISDQKNATAGSPSASPRPPHYGSLLPAPWSSPPGPLHPWSIQPHLLREALRHEKKPRVGQILLKTLVRNSSFPLPPLYPRHPFLQPYNPLVTLEALPLRLCPFMLHKGF